MPTATAQPGASDVLDAEIVDDAPGRNRRQTNPPPKKPKKSATSTGARRDLDDHDDAFERRLHQAEASATERMRDMRHRAKQARRTVLKNKHKYQNKKVRVAGGMALRVTGVGIAGGYLATRSAVKGGRRAYRAASPHVRRVAGHATRAGYAYATVYGHHYARTTRQRVLRTAARHLVSRRRRQQLRSDPLLRAAMVANGQMPTRNIADARRAAGLLDPRTKQGNGRPRRHRPAAGRRTPPATGRQDREAIKRADGIRRDPHQLIRTQEGDEWAFGIVDSDVKRSPPKHVRDALRTPPPSRRRSTPTGAPDGGDTRFTDQGGSPVTTGIPQTTNPVAALDGAFKLVAEYNPANWHDWIQQLRGQAAAYRQASQSYLQLAMFLDLRRRMDPRALAGLYVVAAAMGQIADLFIATANTFWQLYSDRFENAGRGRTMDDENSFFNQ
ncbi:hypothetical protein FHX42_005246 [Saccharopolyspora lacisalsi]|uniref:Uncharacterized protein n=1 Tax=Halosaccharopolyspora lacisalsi TaxID=1000566 RepID=A0A839E4R0_9PSEU|nr:hypothetical protein [Halosaccharopolyspora lacisalsi]MBA8827839.1 hypothetical protein [Halosaccharopolyspora lacisalsi]